MFITLKYVSGTNLYLVSRLFGWRRSAKWITSICVVLFTGIFNMDICFHTHPQDTVMIVLHLDMTFFW